MAAGRRVAPASHEAPFLKFTMNAHQLYRQSAAGSWTRIDMLLKLYEATIECAESGVSQIESRQKVESATRTRMQRLLGQLVDGLDLSQGDVATEVQRLLLFTLQGSETNDLKLWTSMSRVLSTLHEGFNAIRLEAIAAERTGEVPPLSGQTRRETLGLHG